MAKLRSPNYPSLTLAEAIEKVRLVYAVEHTHPTPKEVIAKDLGYGSVNGSSLTAIGALRRYGLLEDAGDGMRVSDDAVCILELPAGDSARNEALKRTAFSPGPFSDLQNEFGMALPGEANLRHWLIKREFLPRAADELIRVYRANLDLVGPCDNGDNENMTGGVEREKPGDNADRTALVPLSRMTAQGPGTGPAQITARRPSPDVIEETGDKSELKLKISTISEAKIIFSGPVTQEAIAKLIALLDLSMDTFPTRAEVEKKGIDPILNEGLFGADA